MTVTYGAASASEWYSNETPGNAIDGSATTYWTTNGSALPQWWSVLTNLTPVTACAIRARDDILARNVNTWLFQGRVAASDIPAGSTTTASSQYDSGTYAAVNATDGNWSSRWASAGTAPAWLRVQLAAATVYTDYFLGGFSTELGGSPRDFTFEGSNDGSAWVTLDTRTGITFSATVFQSFSFTNSTAYLYYRVNVSANTDGANVRVARFGLGPVNVWTTLNSQSGITWSAGQTKTFTFANTTAYNEYRVYITVNNGDTYTSIAEIVMTDVPLIPFPRRAVMLTGVAAQRASRW